MSAEERRSPPLSPAARWVAAGALGLLGTIGVTRGLTGSPTSLVGAGRVAAVSAGGSAGAEGGGPNGLFSTGQDQPRGVSKAQSAGSGNVSRKININTATLAELDILPRIGPTLAARIIADREANGPFGSLDDLDRVPGIGPKTIARLVPYAAAE